MIHCTSGHIDPGFKTVIVLEMYNHGPNTLVLERYMPIAHIVFEKVSLPPSKSYSGQFADQLGA
jgi:deoxycytidine triphosphate deaminase